MGHDKNKILIVKSGYSETFVFNSSGVCSLGDVFRTTVLLNLFMNDEVTWVTDAAALFLLEQNPYIKHLLVFNEKIESKLRGNRYDVIINLEKEPWICSLVEKVPSVFRYGYRFNKTREEMDFFSKGSGVMGATDVNKLMTGSWEQALFFLLGAKWRGESSILGYRPSSKITHDVGFNSHVGPKFPLKAWPEKHWRRLEELIFGKFTFSKQRHLNDIRRYMDWINSCRLLVTNDSLGLHLGVALGKKVLAMFGPTSPSQVPPAPNLKILTPALEWECIPCYKNECSYNDACMDYIFPEVVFDSVDKWGVDKIAGSGE